MSQLAPILKKMENKNLQDIANIECENIFDILFLSEAGYIKEAVEYSHKHLKNEISLEEQEVLRLNLLVCYTKISHQNEMEKIFKQFPLDVAERTKHGQYGNLIEIYYNKALSFYYRQIEDVNQARKHQDLDASLFENEPFLHSIYFLEKAQFSDTSEPDNAKSNVTQAKQVCQGVNSLLLEFLIRQTQVKVFYEIGDYEKCKNHIEDILDKSLYPIGSIHQPELFHVYANLLDVTGEVNQGIEWILRAIELLNNKSYESMLPAYLVNASKMYHNVGDFDKAPEYQDQAKKLLDIYPNIRSLGRLYLSIGNTMHSMGEHDKAKLCFTRGIEISQNTDDQFLKASLMNGSGALYADTREYDKAIEQFLKAYELFYAIGQKIKSSIPLSNVLMIKLNSSDYTDYRLYLGKLDELYKEAPSVQIDLNIQLYNGIYYQHAEPNFDLAESYFMNIIERDDDFYWHKGSALLSLCELKITRLNQDLDPKYIPETLQMLEQLIGIAQSLKSYVMLLNITRFRARLEIVNNNLDEATRVLEEGLKIAEQQNIVRLIEWMKYELHNVQEISKRWQSAKKDSITLKQRIIETNLMEVMKTKGATSGSPPEF